MVLEEEKVNYSRVNSFIVDIESDGETELMQEVVCKLKRRKKRSNIFRRHFS